MAKLIDQPGVSDLVAKTVAASNKKLAMELRKTATAIIIEAAGAAGTKAETALLKALSKSVSEALKAREAELAAV